MTSSDLLKIQGFFYANPDTYPPIVNAVRMLAENGFQVDLMCPADGRDWKVAYPDRVRVLRFDTHGRGPWKDYASFLKHCMRSASRQSRFFWGHDMHGLLVARLMGWRYSRPVVYQCHEYVSRTVPLPSGSRVVRAFEQHLAQTSALVVVPDRGRAEAMLKEMFLPCCPTVVANAPRLSPKRKSDVLRRRLAEAGKGWERIVFRQGRVGPGHAIENTIRSIPMWSNRRWGFAVMGMVSEPFREALGNLARECGVEQQFHVLAPVGYDQVADYTVGADVGHGFYEPVNFTNLYYATSSNKILEYMAAGLPLLVSDTVRMREMVSSNRYGLTADEGSPAKIAAAVNELLANPGKAEEMGREGRNAFESRYCFDRQFGPVVERFKFLANGAPGYQCHAPQLGCHNDRNGRLGVKSGRDLEVH